MSEYQYLTSKIQVPKEWPLKNAGTSIFIAVKQAIRHHRSALKISLTVSDVSALVTDNENGPGYIFKNIEETHEDTGRIDLIKPVKTELVMPDSLALTGSQWSETFPMSVRQDHPISRMLVPRSDCHVVLIATPIIEQVLEQQGVRDPAKHDFTLRSINIINNKLYKDVLLQETSSSSQSGHPSIDIEPIGEDKWGIVYDDCL